MATPPNDVLRVMIDTNVLIAGMGWPRFPYEVLRHAVRGDFQLLLSPYTIAEARRHVTRLFPEELDTLEEFLVVSRFEAVEDPSQAELEEYPQFVRDVADIPVALSAIFSQVECLVSSDKDLTAEDESTAALHKQLKIVLPGTFLREYMGWTSEQLEAIRRREWADLA